MKRNFAKEMQKMNDFLHKKIEQNLELEVRSNGWNISGAVSKLILALLSINNGLFDSRLRVLQIFLLWDFGGSSNIDRIDLFLKSLLIVQDSPLMTK